MISSVDVGKIGSALLHIPAVHTFVYGGTATTGSLAYFIIPFLKPVAIACCIVLGLTALLYLAWKVSKWILDNI